MDQVDTDALNEIEGRLWQAYKPICEPVVRKGDGLEVAECIVHARCLRIDEFAGEQERRRCGAFVTSARGRYLDLVSFEDFFPDVVAQLSW